VDKNMKRKITIVSIITILMLVTISYETALNTKDVEKKESPLYKIRTKNAIKEKIGEIIKNIKTRFLNRRIFFIPGDRFYYTESFDFWEWTTKPSPAICQKAPVYTAWEGKRSFCTPCYKTDAK
jgi:hypothetical protein